MKRLFYSALFLLLCISVSAQNTKVKIYTSFGDFVVTLEDSLAPITSGNFINLVNQKYYDSVLIHRVVPGFVIQGGDATRTGGTTSPIIQDEFSPLLSNVQKTISMANRGPNTGTSQFFINLVDNVGLDYNKAPSSSAHPVFGTVTEGWTVVQTIGTQPNSGPPSNSPNTPIVMDSARVLPPPASIFEQQSESLSLFPNPANDVLYIQSKQGFSFRVIDVRGGIVLQGSFEASEIKSFDVSNLPSGIYLLNFDVDGLFVHKKISINR